MLNQIVPTATEANFSGVFLKNYLEYIEDFPDDIMRILSISRELDIKTNNIVNEAEELSEKIISATGDKKAKLYVRLQQILIKLQDYNDEKIHYGQVLSDMIETKFRAVERDYQNNINNKQERIQSPVPSSSSTARNASIHQQVLQALPLKNSSAPGSNMSSSTNNSASETNAGGTGSGQDKGAKRVRRTRTETNVDVERFDVPVKVEPSSSKQVTTPVQPAVVAKKVAGNTVAAKKKKQQANKVKGRQTSGQTTQAVQEQVPGALPDDTIDPDEETYCLCGQISYGEMILCENDLCPIEWFHFSCVSLQSKPKGRWYCPSCRGDRPNVMNKKFLRKKYQDSPTTDRKFV